MNPPERSALFYMANLGSEFVRVFKAFDQKNDLACRSAAERCFSVINKLKLLEEMMNREQEIARLEDILNDLTSGEPKYSVSRFQIEQYFNPFALRMMKR